MPRWTRICLIVYATVAAPVVVAQQAVGCGTLQNAVGPYDYYDPAHRNDLAIVETNHFTPDVEALRRGRSDVNVIGDIEFVLRHFPNHPRALNAVGRYANAGGRFRPEGIPSGDCFFIRAVQFRPKDPTVRLLFANFLTRQGNQSDARAQYEVALELSPASAEVNYNAGLFFINQGDVQRAKQLAKIAYDAGYPLPGLRQKIEAAESGKPHKPQ